MTVPLVLPNADPKEFNAQWQAMKQNNCFESKVLMRLPPKGITTGCFITPLASTACNRQNTGGLASFANPLS